MQKVNWKRPFKKKNLHLQLLFLKENTSYSTATREIIYLLCIFNNQKKPQGSIMCINIFLSLQWTCNFSQLKRKIMTPFQLNEEQESKGKQGVCKSMFGICHVRMKKTLSQPKPGQNPVWEINKRSSTKLFFGTLQMLIEITGVLPAPAVISNWSWEESTRTQAGTDQCWSGGNGHKQR